MKHRVILALAIVLAGATTSTILADPDCAVSRCVYLPTVQYAPLPTPVPTPIPPAMETLVIQLSQMRSGYTRQVFGEVTNTDAAKNYADPKAVALAFQQQGRETSWRVTYGSTDYLTSDAIAVGNQVYRYLTPDGAAQGFSYSINKTFQDHPEYRVFNLSAPCCPITGLRRSFTDSGTRYDQFYIIVRSGRYVTDVQVVGLAGVVSVDRAVAYANLALLHLLNTPQTIQFDAATAPAGGGTPQGATIPYHVLTPQ